MVQGPAGAAPVPDGDAAVALAPYDPALAPPRRPDGRASAPGRPTSAEVGEARIGATGGAAGGSLAAWSRPGGTGRRLGRRRAGGPVARERPVEPAHPRQPAVAVGGPALLERRRPRGGGGSGTARRAAPRRRRRPRPRADRMPCTAAAPPPTPRSSGASVASSASGGRPSMAVATAMRAQARHLDALVAVGHRQPLGQRHRRVLGDRVRRVARLGQQAGGRRRRQQVAAAPLEHAGHDAPGRRTGGRAR